MHVLKATYSQTDYIINLKTIHYIRIQENNLHLQVTKLYIILSIQEMNIYNSYIIHYVTLQVTMSIYFSLK